MKSVPLWIRFSVLRILLFAVPLTVLLLSGVNVWVAVLIGAVFGFSASLLFLRQQRESMAQDLYAARHRDRPLERDDDQAEDAAVDASAVRRSEGEDESHPDAVEERGQTREL